MTDRPIDAMLAFASRCIRAYIDSLPADHPERVAYETAIAELGGAT